jgi:hypothetical protein
MTTKAGLELTIIHIHPLHFLKVAREETVRLHGLC